MANTFSLQTIHDGKRNLVVQLDIVGDGSGEESATLFIDISTYASDPRRGAPTGCKIEKIKATLEGFAAKLLWDATTDVEAFLLGQTPTDMRFTHGGGLVNNAGSGKTGDIRITTVGLGSGDQGTIILYLRKTYG